MKSKEIDPLDVTMAAIKGILSEVLKYQSMDEDELSEALGMKDMMAEGVEDEMDEEMPEDELIEATVVAEDEDELQAGLEEAADMLDEADLEELMAAAEEDLKKSKKKKGK